MGVFFVVLKISLLVAPVILSPLIIFLLRMLFPYFLQEGAKLFTAIELPGSLARKVGTDIAIRNVIIFVVCWVASYGCTLLEFHYSWSILIAVSSVFLALFFTITLVKGRLSIRSWSDAGLVGLVAFAGGNLPLFILVGLAMGMTFIFSGS
ncbi:MAG: hypothetical protein O7G85_17230 [Planctomycetota bacterium]|nr:hypothetical protein [Planctomycetota bacterium]